ncbi:alpha/beta fold hydrolase [Maribius pontilimi]|uniref:Alpha/beta fold hydrolase n=1 Tax=Palleronia pontilimi TaxID=1964209 RepID=A0A934I937_9RHOB|nr:alpha/beta hydrolase [Palleronia pontilimi]MBJ3762744.1 alpha/beta fold hydrolase [Palleronia pontilimi]
MGMPLVLLPGFMSDLRVWGPQIEALAQDHTLVLPTLGTFDSVERMAENLLPQLPQRFALAGHSLGGHVAMELLRRAPDRVERIAILSAPCLAETPPMAAERELRMVRAKGGRLAAVMAEDLPKTCLADGDLCAPLHGFVLEMAERFGVDAYLAQSRAMQKRPDCQRVLRTARLPSLVMGGAEDTVVRPQRLEFLAGLMPKASLRIIDGAGHLPMLERPDRVTGALMEWMEWPLEALLLR